ncbi:MAG: segregation/condensation protein A [Rhizobiales bacterium]|nr:segregation/condensation protein A [Hyphomicrobiales bacterium]
MDATQTDVSTLNGYQLRLPSFEGPFDVLLRLIERSQLAITDISLVAVTDQFLQRIAELGGAPPSLIAEFTAVGSRLVLLKSRSLLPRPAAAEGEDDAASELARELIEYRAVKAASLELAKRDAMGQGAFGRALGAVGNPDADAPPKLARHEANALTRAIRRRLSVTPSPRTLLTRKPIVTIREMAQRWLDLVRGEANVTFHQFGGRCDDASELRTAFLAMLVLIRRRLIDADQHEPFGAIHVRLADPTGTISEASEFE